MGTGFPEFLGATGSTRAWVDAMRNYCREIEQRLDYVISQCHALREQNESLVGQVRSVQSQIPEVAPAAEVTVSSNTTLTIADVNQVLLVNCTSSSTLTLPSPTQGAWLRVHNRGTGTLTISDGVNTICTLVQNRGCDMRCALDSAGNQAWPTHVPSTGLDGFEVRKSQLVFDNSNAGIALKDSSGNYWSLVFDDTGALVSTDQGPDFASETSAIPD